MDIKRLEQFMLVMLSSDQPGEVATASTMLKRELKKGGKDIHWLKDNLLKGGNGDGSIPHDYGELLKAKNRWTHAERRLGEMRQERDKAIGECAALRHELDMIKRAAGGYAQPEPPREDMFERARRARAGKWETYNGENRYYEEREDMSYPGDPPPDTEERFHIAAWCVRYTSTNPSLIKNEREREFIQDMSRRHGALSYAQETWLMDVFHRLRRHHSMKAEGG